MERAEQRRPRREVDETERGGEHRVAAGRRPPLFDDVVYPRTKARLGCSLSMTEASRSCANAHFCCLAPETPEDLMPKYVVLYRFTAEGAKNIRNTVERARQTREENEKRGFKVQTILWTQGPYDIVSIIDAPSEDAMMRAMTNVVGAGNVSSTTMRAFDDKEMEAILK
jgi:uncharacterized protein with GYD domain